MDIRKEAELRVLRQLIKNKGEVNPDGMEEHEYKAACYRLEEKHCVQLARIYGGFEAIRILDEGYVYLKELKIEEEKETSELERLKTENAMLKAISGKKEHQHSLFEKTQKFVQDTLYFCNVIQSNEFYDHDGYFYQQTKKRYDSYCDVNEDELVKEVNNSPLQTYFDDFKKLLNSIVIPNYDTMSMSKYIQENLTSDRELLEDALEIFETVVEKCGNLRNSVENFRELYDLKDNSPKRGFLRPEFIDEVINEKEEQKAESNNTELRATSSTDKEKEFEELKKKWNEGKAKLILIRLKEKGIITDKDNVYEWKVDKEHGYGKNLYVYFVYKASEKLGWRMGKRNNIVPWCKFNPMFPNVSVNQGVNNQSLQDIKNNKNIPSFAYMIDEILNW